MRYIAGIIGGGYSDRCLFAAGVKNGCTASGLKVIESEAHPYENLTTNGKALIAYAHLLYEQERYSQNRVDYLVPELCLCIDTPYQFILDGFENDEFETCVAKTISSGNYDFLFYLTPNGDNLSNEDRQRLEKEIGQEPIFSPTIDQASAIISTTIQNDM